MIISAGRRFRLAATSVEGGVNSCLFASRASRLELLLLDDADDAIR